MLLLLSGFNSTFIYINNSHFTALHELNVCVVAPHAHHFSCISGPPSSLLFCRSVFGSCPFSQDLWRRGTNAFALQGQQRNVLFLQGMVGPATDGFPIGLEEGEVPDRSPHQAGAVSVEGL